MMEAEKIAALSRKLSDGTVRAEAWGILNPYGTLWTHQTFLTEQDARDYVAQWWKGMESDGDLSRFRPVRVHVTVAPTEARP